MAKYTVNYELSGFVSSTSNLPASGFSKRSVSLTCGNSVISRTIGVTTGNQANLLKTAFSLGVADFLVIHSTQDAMITWYTDTTANNCSVALKANVPFFLPNPNVPTYAATTAAAIDDDTSSTTPLTFLHYYNNSGSTAYVTVFGLGTDS